ncbi:DUF3846 domain-containing protein [Herbiconiux daphne]|uniref:DUF3846 domain-containing protein n=1 Tax=Herbiconiux daphne TaxID=2970914 RepID=A0ABT2H548_9MICO|nr:DUF3846 domain-containing protein [Herbiconiux daphne]MCS5735062.1 DUF3846 domain-containing protein [Herbiconiux daphne]
MPIGIVIPHDESSAMYEQNFEGLSSYQAAVGGYIEPVRLEEAKLLIYANEEGKIRRLPVNRRATAIWWLHDRMFREVDELVGDVVLLGRSGNVPKELAELVLRTSRFRVEVRIADRLGWHDMETELNSYVDAALFALLDFRSSDEVTDIRVVSA